MQEESQQAENTYQSIDLAIVSHSNTLQPGKVHKANISDIKFLYKNDLAKFNRLYSGQLGNALKQLVDAESVFSSDKNRATFESINKKNFRIGMYNTASLRQAIALLPIPYNGQDSNFCIVKSKIWGEEGKKVAIALSADSSEVSLSYDGELILQNEKIDFFPIKFNNNSPIDIKVEVGEKSIRLNCLAKGIYQGTYQEIQFSFTVSFIGKTFRELLEEFNHNFENIQKDFKLGLENSPSISFEDPLSNYLASTSDNNSSEIDPQTEIYKIELGFFDIASDLHLPPIDPLSLTTNELKIRANGFNLRTKAKKGILKDYLEIEQIFFDNSSYYNLSSTYFGVEFTQIITDDKLRISNDHSNGKIEVDLKQVRGQEITVFLEELQKQLASFNSTLAISGELKVTSNFTAANNYFGGLASRTERFTTQSKNIEVYTFSSSQHTENLGLFISTNFQFLDSETTPIYLRNPVSPQGNELDLIQQTSLNSFEKAFSLLQTEQVEFLFPYFESSITQKSLRSPTDEVLNNFSYLSYEDVLHVHRLGKEHVEYMSHKKRGKYRFYVASGITNQLTLADNINYKENISSDRTIYFPYRKTYELEPNLDNPSPALFACFVLSLLCFLPLNISISLLEVKEPIEEEFDLSIPADLDKLNIPDYGMVYANSSKDNLGYFKVSKIVTTHSNSGNKKAKDMPLTFARQRILDRFQKEFNRSLHNMIIKKNIDYKSDPNLSLSANEVEKEAQLILSKFIDKNYLKSESKVRSVKITDESFYLDSSLVVQKELTRVSS